MIGEKNAIILAAGKSSRFAPFTYEKPKGLFRVKGEILIERQIEQMIAAQIKDIYVVVGYMKEKFFYLERKYPQVHLIVNNKFGASGNLYSLYVVRNFLKNSFVSYADYYFTKNPFVDDNPRNESYHACVFRSGKFNEFSATVSDADVITHVVLGGCDLMAMVGHAYFNEGFSKKFVELLNQEINEFRVNALFWEEFFERHIKELTLHLKELHQGEVIEFNSIEDLRQFDSDFLYNVDSDIIANICNSLKCEPNEIVDIAVINAGLTNVSFRFFVKGVEYVYRHPGGTAGNLIDRRTEQYMQLAAKEIGVDKSVIEIPLDGWKLSYCVQNLTECDFRKYPEQMKKGMEYLRKVHSIAVPTDGSVKRFDNFEETIKLMKIASATKGNLLREFADEIAKARKLDSFLKADAVRMGLKPTCCHNDIYEPNFLATKDGDLYLIDWEYAGVNDPANDVAGLFSRYHYEKKDIDAILNAYFQRKPTADEYRHWVAHIPLSAFYWMGWGLYKGSVGEEDGFFFLPAYRIFHQYIEDALKSFEE